MAGSVLRNEIILTFFVVLYAAICVVKQPSVHYNQDRIPTHTSVLWSPWSHISFNSDPPGDSNFVINTSQQVHLTITSHYKAAHPTWVPHQKRLAAKPATSLLQLLILLQAGDLEVNPGPYKPKYPCEVCSKAVKWGQQALKCDDCEGWIHRDCIGMNSETYQALANNSASWICCNCGLPNFSSSLFLTSLSDLDISNPFSINDFFFFKFIKALFHNKKYEIPHFTYKNHAGFTWPFLHCTVPLNIINDLAYII